MTNPLMHMTVGTGLPFLASGDSILQARVSNDRNLLYAWGRAVDVVTKIGLSLDEIPSIAQDELSRGERLQESLKTLLAHRREFAFGEKSDDEILEEHFETFWHASLCNLTAWYDRPPSEYGTYFRKYVEFFHHPEKFNLEDEAHQAFRNNLVNIETASNAGIRGWRLCTTQKGRLGQVISSVEVGDIICILSGGELPYAIRPQENGEYKFIASCYVHGLMDGEGCAIEGLEEEFCFC